MFKKITKDSPGLDIAVYAKPEHLPTGSSEFDRGVRKMVKEHGAWGWCTAVVQVDLGNLSGKSFLGACSYKSVEDFVECGDYFPQMLEEAIDELQGKIDNLIELLEVA